MFYFRSKNFIVQNSIVIVFAISCYVMALFFWVLNFSFVSEKVLTTRSVLDFFLHSTKCLFFIFSYLFHSICWLLKTLKIVNISEVPNYSLFVAAKPNLSRLVIDTSNSDFSVGYVFDYNVKTSITKPI